MQTAKITVAMRAPQFSCDPKWSRRRALIERSARFFSEALRIDASLTIKIEAHSSKVGKGTHGHAQAPVDGVCRIRVLRDLPASRLLHVIAHEMVHAKQFQTGDLTIVRGVQTYRGVRQDQLAWDERGHEEQAERMAAQLVDAIVASMGRAETTLARI